MHDSRGQNGNVTARPRNASPCESVTSEQSHVHECRGMSSPHIVHTQRCDPVGEIRKRDIEGLISHYSQAFIGVAIAPSWRLKAHVPKVSHTMRHRQSHYQDMCSLWHACHRAPSCSKADLRQPKFLARLVGTIREAACLFASQSQVCQRSETMDRGTDIHSNKA